MSLEITEELPAQQPPESQAIIRMLLVKISELEARLNKTPKNSSKPPSSEHPHAKPEPPPKPKSKRKRGGQPGHDKFERSLIPSSECEKVVPCRPESCRGCGTPLKGTDKVPIRDQVWDIQIRTIVTEYQRHRLTCRCGMTTCGQLPDTVIGRTGPTLAAILVLMTSWFRTSRRKAAAFSIDICQVPCSAGHVSELEKRATAVLQESYDELAATLPDQANLAIDETPCKRGRVKTWLWTFVAAGFTVFVLRPTRKATVLTETISLDFAGSINCDRAKMYFQHRILQWCRAHLKRDFQALIDSGDGQKKRLGHDLMRETRKLFAEYAKCRDGTIKYSTLQKNLWPVRQQLEALLLRGFGTAAHGMCKQLYKHRDHLWTFLSDPHVQPANNGAERSLRHAVIRRKLSFGTQSERGDRFVEVMLTVIETCRQQKRSVLQFVRQAIQHRKTESLLLGP